MNKNYLFCIAMFAKTFFASAPTEYTQLKHPKHSVANLAQHEKFRKEYRAEFAQIWKDEKNLKKEYTTSQASCAVGNAEQHRTLTYKQFVVEKMKSSYKLKFTQTFPNAELTKLPGHLEQKAHEEVIYYIEEGTCCGPCWLCCSGVK